MIDKKTITLSCVECSGNLVEGDKIYHCADCNKEYVVANGISILLPDGERFLNETFASMQTLRKRMINYIEQNRSLFYLQDKRSEALNSFCQHYECNIEFYRKFAAELNPYIEPELLALSNYTFYQNEPLRGKEINYLMRDWGGLPEAEAEIENMLNVLKRLIDQFKPQNAEVAFFPGCGTGRLAFEFAKDFRQLFCTDLSYRMVSLFNKMLDGQSLDIYEVNDFSDIYYTKDNTRLITAKVRNKGIMPDNITRFVSDIKQIPLSANSVDVITSVYFLDVLNIELYIDELHRVLNEGGLYINLGPIGYPRSTRFIHKLLPEEIKDVFRQHGFEILHEEFLENSYMKSSLKMTTLIHKNWVFAARKKKAVDKKHLEIFLDTVLKLDKKVFVEKSAQLSDKGENVFYYKFYNFRGDTYEGAALVIEILQLIDGVKSVLEIKKTVELKFDINVEAEDLLPILKDLLMNNVVKIVEL